MNLESELNRHDDRHGFAIERSWPEQPLPRRSERRLIESVVQRFDDARSSDDAVSPNGRFDDDTP